MPSSDTPSSTARKATRTVVVEREDALKLLASESQVERLRAARALRGLFTESDRPAIEAALKVESDAWVRAALSTIVTLDLEERTATRPLGERLVEDPAQLAQDVKAQTTQELTAMVTHELAPLWVHSDRPPRTKSQETSRRVGHFGRSRVLRRSTEP